jgi:hypothetical protein
LLAARLAVILPPINRWFQKRGRAMKIYRGPELGFPAIKQFGPQASLMRLGS